MLKDIFLLKYNEVKEMPTSRKRVKKPQQEETVPKTRNIVKTKTGKAVILLLSLGFVLSVVIGLIVVIINVMAL